MISVLWYALMLTNSVNTATVEIYSTAINCEIMAQRVRDTVPDHGVQISCWPVTTDDPDQAREQVADLRALLTEPTSP
jgi:hypothetical protein